LRLAESVFYDTIRRPARAEDASKIAVSIVESNGGYMAESSEGNRKTGEKLLRWAVLILISILVFGGLYVVIQHLE
jgi:hypothetical protein